MNGVSFLQIRNCWPRALGVVALCLAPALGFAQATTHVTDAPGAGGPTGAVIPEGPVGSSLICDQMAMVPAGTYTAANGNAIAGEVPFGMTSDLQVADDCILGAESEITQVCQASLTFFGLAPDQGVWVQVYADAGGMPAATATFSEMVPAGNVTTTPFVDTVFGLEGLILCANLSPNFIIPAGTWFWDLQPVDTVAGDWYFLVRTADGAPTGADSFGKDGGTEHGAAFGGPYPGGYGTDVWTSMAGLNLGAGDAAMSIAGQAVGTARFLVSKNFNDDNEAEVEVTLSCNTGLPLEQDATISEGDPVNFVVVDYEPGTLDCEVTEVVPDGYTASYDDGTISPDNCSYEDIVGGQFECAITNSLEQVEVEVTKVWIDENPQFNAVNIADARWSCSNVASGQSNGFLNFFGNPDTESFFVFPDWDGGTSCSITEVNVPDGGVEVDDSDCQGLVVFPGEGASCAIVNTRLFEGIPTLSQYGLMLLAMLMLGIGFVAFRRMA